MMNDKVKELSNLGLKAFAIGAGHEEVFASSLKMIHSSYGLRIFWSLLTRTNKQFLVLKRVEKGNYRHPFAFQNFVAS